MQSSLLGFLLIKLPEQSDWSLTFLSGDPLVDLTRYSPWPFCQVSSCCIPTSSCGPCLSNYGSAQALCSSHPILCVRYQTLLCWPRLRSSMCFQTKDMQWTHSGTFCTFLWPSRPGLHVLTSKTQRLMSLVANTAHCLFMPQQQGCSAGWGNPCSASLWLPSALVSGLLHYILHSNPDSKEERSMAMHPAWWAGDWEAIYFIFPPSQTNALGI